MKTDVKFSLLPDNRFTRFSTQHQTPVKVNVRSHTTIISHTD